eukprot:gene9126-9897_t
MSKKENIDEFYKSLGINIPNKKDLQQEKLFNLYEIPKKVKPWPSVDKSNIEENAVQQCDILYLPNDDGFKYCLVVCDVGGYRKTDAEPLKTKSATEVLKAFKEIYKRKILKVPTYMLQCDSGSEFHGSVKKFFEDQGIAIRYGKPDHHQSQASELQTGVKSVEWVEFLPTLITALNKRLKKHTKTFQKFDAPVKANKNNNDLLDEGTKVRVALDAPIDVPTEGKLHGKFRATDIRWEKEPTVIKQILLRPDQPPMYLTAKYPHTPYVRERLQVVPENEANPPLAMQNKFVVEKLLERKKIGNAINFLVKWKNIPVPNWQPRTHLMKQIPDLVKEFEKNNK